METNLYRFNNSEVTRIVSSAYDDEKSLQVLLEHLIRSEKRLLGNKIVAYKREIQTDSGRPDFVLLDSEGRIILVECKIISNEGIRRKIIAQLLDYTVYLSQIKQSKGWVFLSPEVSPNDVRECEDEEPLLIIVCDKVHHQLHRLVTFLETKTIEIKIVTINKFCLGDDVLYTITTHDSEPDQIKSSSVERLNTQIESFKEDKLSVKNILESVETLSTIAKIKGGKKRIAIHIIGASERFAIWISQRGLRQIQTANISIPKAIFQPCSEGSSEKIFKILAGKYQTITHNHDDVYAYIELEKVKNIVGDVINTIYENLE